MKNDLLKVREELFDAPTEVKSAFNAVVNYFSAQSLAMKMKAKRKPEVLLRTLIMDYKVAAKSGKYDRKELTELAAADLSYTLQLIATDIKEGKQFNQALNGSSQRLKTAWKNLLKAYRKPKSITKEKLIKAAFIKFVVELINQE